MKIPPQSRALRVLCAIAIGLIGSSPAAADEAELMAVIRQLQERVAQLEQQRQVAPVPAPSLTSTPTPPPAPSGTPLTLPSGLELTLYGRGDIGYTTSRGANAAGETFTNHRFNQGEMASRLGLSGAWNFENGLKAIFGIETGINLFNGNAGGGVQNYNNVTGTTNTNVLFNRGATVGLASARYGSIEGGTMYMAPFWVALAGDQASAHGYGANDFSALFSVERPESLARYLKDSPAPGATSGGNSGTALFYGNALRYRTIKLWDAVTGELSYSNGQQVANATTPNRHDGRAVALNVQYNKAPLYLGYAHMNYLQAGTNAAGVWQSRDQITDIVSARYKWGDFTLGGSFTNFRVTNAGGYAAQAYGLSGGYDLGRNRFEASVGRVGYRNAGATGGYGPNTGMADAGDPASTAYSLGYLFNIQPNLSLYAYYTRMNNNDAARLGTLQFRSDTNLYGYSPSEWTVGMFYVF